MKTKTCLFSHEAIKVMMDNFCEVGGGGRWHTFFYPRFFFNPRCLHSTLGGDIISQVAKGTLQ